MRRHSLLCSHCSETIKPVVALDIDGTMGDFHKHFVRFLVDYKYGRSNGRNPYAEYSGSMPFKEWCCRRFSMTGQEWYDAKLAYRQGAQKRSMPFRGWPKTLTRLLRFEGVEVWVTTTRPYLRMDNIDPDTRFWLANNGVYYDHLLYDEDKYSQLLNRVGPDRVCAILDDLNEDLERAASLFDKSVCILFRDEHNRAYWNRWETKVHEGQTATEAILNRVNIWRSRYERSVLGGTPTN